MVMIQRGKYMTLRFGHAGNGLHPSSVRVSGGMPYSHTPRCPKTLCGLISDNETPCMSMQAYPFLV